MCGRSVRSPSRFWAIGKESREGVSSIYTTVRRTTACRSALQPLTERNPNESTQAVPSSRAPGPRRCSSRRFWSVAPEQRPLARSLDPRAKRASSARAQRGYRVEPNATDDRANKDAGAPAAADNPRHARVCDAPPGHLRRCRRRRRRPAVSAPSASSRGPLQRRPQPTRPCTTYWSRYTPLSQPRWIVS
jgi:hypothetical protein